MSKEITSEKLNIAGKDLVPVMQEQINAGKTVRFFPKGVSMLPLIRQGRDSVTLKVIDRPLRRFDIVFYQRDNGQYVLHRLVDQKDTITCIGDNQYVYERGLRPDQMIAVVSELTRDKKTVSINSLSYRVYSVYWYISRPFRYFIVRAIGKIKRTIKAIIKR